MRTKSRLATVAAMTMLFTTSVAYGGQLDIYEHNGSVIDWFVVNGDVTATYSQPKPSLQRSGIRDGSVLFKGAEEGNRVTGKAFVFRNGCAPAPYDVVGYFEGSNIVLTGPSPVRAKGSCEVVRYTLDSPNAKLVFRYSSTHH